MKQLIFGILFVFLFNSIWSLEEYSEELHISSLPNNDLSYLFRFITTASGDGNAENLFRLFPMTIKQLFDYNIEEFQLSMTTGFWKHDVWGIQPKTDSPTGFLLLVKFSDNMTEETISKTWSLIVKQVNGFFCSSILEIDPVLTVIPTFINENAKNYRFAHLSGEPLCTENIKPFLRLLPCKTSGLGTLIFSNDFFNTPFHSLSIHATKKQNDFNVELIAQIIKSKLSLLKNGGQFAQLTSLTNNLKCSVAKKQRITHDLKSNYEARIDDKEFLTFDLTTMNETTQNQRFKVLMNRNGLEKIKTYSPLLSLTIAQEQSDFRGGIMSTTIFNNLNEDLFVSYFHMIPWQFRIEIDTLNFQCKQNDNNFKNFPFLKKHLDPALIEKKALAFEIGLNLSKNSLCILNLKFSNYLMIALSYPPDSNYGIFVPSPILTVNVSNEIFAKHSINFERKKQEKKEQIRIYGEPLLILLPVPDFSMPFNVIVIATTVAGYFFGSIYNINIKAYLPNFK